MKFEPQGKIIFPSSLRTISRVIVNCCLDHLTAHPNHELEPIRSVLFSDAASPVFDSPLIVRAEKEYICFISGENVFLVFAVSVVPHEGDLSGNCLLVLHLNCASRKKDFKATKLRCNLADENMSYLYQKDISRNGRLFKLTMEKEKYASERMEQKTVDYVNGQFLYTHFTTQLVSDIWTLAIRPLQFV
jgi:hypothetical protein